MPVYEIDIDSLYENVKAKLTDSEQSDLDQLLWEYVEEKDVSEAQAKESILREAGVIRKQINNTPACDL